MSENWCEGNTFAALENIANVLDSRKLEVMIQLCKIYKEKVYPLEPDEVINWMDNNVVIFFAGFHIDTSDSSNWDKVNFQVSEKAPYLTRISSFESIFLFLMRQKLSTLNLLLKKHKECFYSNMKASCDYSIVPSMKALEQKQNKVKTQTGGSNTISILDDFLKINPKNAVRVKSYLKTFIKNKATVESLRDDVCKVHNTEPSLFWYSDRIFVPDVWKITMFLLQQK